MRDTADLHELHGEMKETGADEPVRDRKAQGNEPVLPVSSELAQDVSGVVFINKGVPLHNAGTVSGL